MATLTPSTTRESTVDDSTLITKPYCNTPKSTKTAVVQHQEKENQRPLSIPPRLDNQWWSNLGSTKTTTLTSDVNNIQTVYYVDCEALQVKMGQSVARVWTPTPIEADAQNNDDHHRRRSTDTDDNKGTMHENDQASVSSTRHLTLPPVPEAHLTLSKRQLQIVEEHRRRHIEDVQRMVSNGSCTAVHYAC